MKLRSVLPVALLMLLPGCTQGPVNAAELDPAHDSCAACRMAVSDPRFAAQVVVPGEEPRFFDDLGCLRKWLAGRADLPAGAAAFVADHRTRAWVRAEQAVYTRVDALPTPMSSHLIAHADAASREADPAARGGAPVAAADLLGGRLARVTR